MPKARKVKTYPVIGRPVKYRKDMDDQAFRLALLGLLNIEIAEFFAINQDTFYEWRKTYESFSEAITRGRTPAVADVAQSMHMAAIGYTHASEEIKVIDGQVVRVPIIKHYPPDVKAAMFILRNRAKRDWKGNPEEGDGDNKTITVVVKNARSDPDNG